LDMSIMQGRFIVTILNRYICLIPMQYHSFRIYFLQKICTRIFTIVWTRNNSYVTH
jgi:hypothetical protein